MPPNPPPKAVQWSPEGDAVRIIDQRELPVRLVERDLRTLDELCDAIRTLAVRGAPAIGVAAAMGLAVVAPGLSKEQLTAAARRIRDTRPTAVNLGWALARMLARSAGASDIPAALREEATAILAEDEAMCLSIGRNGLPLLPPNAQVLTHCNAGALATGGIGTALAPIYLAAAGDGRVERVYACETRPLLQGARLTAWELAQAGIPVTILADSMAASLMRQGEVDLCIVGADRIAANGDVANKIGTYALALAARHHDIPFYVAAPASTFDASTRTGNDIPIEQRDASEIKTLLGMTTAPEAAFAWNPAFDITPASLITAIISDRGVHRPPYDFAAGLI